jgi:phosphohistidine swiveling domain-containing protein
MPKNTDLFKHLERKMPSFNLTVSLWSHSKFFEDLVGTGFASSVFVYHGGTCELNYSKKEVRDVCAAFLKLAKSHDAKLTTWYERSLAANQKTDELMALYAKGAGEITSSKYDEALKVFVENFNFSTVLPYWFLAALDDVLLKGGSRDEFEKELGMYEKLKSETRYPQLAVTVFGIFFEKAAAVLGVSKELAMCLTPDELRAVLMDGMKIASLTLENRNKWCAISTGSKPFDVTFVFDPTTVKIEKTEILTDAREFKGNIAFKGIVRGVAKIVNTMEDMRKFEEGNILVSMQSSPSIMPALMKCAAIVTDDGGIMCHAAIISRELKKPCIIGTKIATKVLKDGDIVEVDAEKGIVKILS